MKLIILRSVPRGSMSGAENQAKIGAPAAQNANPRLLSMDEVRRRWQAKRIARHGSLCDSPQPA